MGGWPSCAPALLGLEEEVLLVLMPTSSYRLAAQNMAYMCGDHHYWGDAVLLLSLQCCVLPEAVWVSSFTAVINCFMLLIASGPWQEVCIILTVNDRKETGLYVRCRLYLFVTAVCYHLRTPT